MKKNLHIPIFFCNFAADFVQHQKSIVMKKEHVYGAICFFLVVTSLCAIYATIYFCRPKITVKTRLGNCELRVSNPTAGFKTAADYYSAAESEINDR